MYHRPLPLTCNTSLSHKNRKPLHYLKHAKHGKKIIGFREIDSEFFWNKMYMYVNMWGVYVYDKKMGWPWVGDGQEPGRKALNQQRRLESLPVQLPPVVNAVGGGGGRPK